jgi:hypothetical protein
MPTKLVLFPLALAAASGAIAFAVVSRSSTAPKASKSSVSGALVAQHTPAAKRAAPSRTAVPQVFLRAATKADSLPPGVDEDDHAGLRSADARRVAMAAQSTRGRAVYLAQTRKGQTCIVIADSDGGDSAGCRPSKVALPSVPLFWTSTIDGGPGVDRITEVTIGGVLGSADGVLIQDVSGAVHDLEITTDGGFVYGGSGDTLPAVISGYTSRGSSRVIISSTDLTDAYS